MEHFSEELANARQFTLRVLKFQVVATLFLVAGLAPGVVGFSLIENLSAHDAILNCLSMLGAVDLPHRPVSLSGLYFTAIYGIFLDSIFLVSMGTVMAPFGHRILHRYNLSA